MKSTPVVWPVGYISVFFLFLLSRLGGKHFVNVCFVCADFFFDVQITNVLVIDSARRSAGS